VSSSCVPLHRHSSQLSPALARRLRDRGAKGAVCLLCSCTQPQHPPSLALVGWVGLGNPLLQPYAHMHYFEHSHLLLQPRFSSSFQDHINSSFSITTVPSKRWVLCMKEHFTHSIFRRLLFPSYLCKKKFLKDNVNHTDGARRTEKSQMLPDLLLMRPQTNQRSFKARPQSLHPWCTVPEHH